MKRLLVLSLILTLLVALMGCAGMSRREQQTLSGGAIGAGGGAALGAITGGSPALGAVIGGASGAAAGYLWDDITGERERYRRHPRYRSYR